MKDNYQVKKTAHPAILIVFMIICGLILIHWLQEDRKIDAINLKKGFAGTVKRVDYDIKEFPTITIGDSSYYIGAGYNTDHQIEVGDSVIKKSGSDIYEVIKQRSHKIILMER